MQEKDRNVQMKRALEILGIVGDHPRSNTKDIAQLLCCRSGMELHTRTIRRYLNMLQEQGLAQNTRWGWRATYKLIPLDPTNRTDLE